MTFDQGTALFILFGVIAALIHGRLRADVVAIAGAAALLATGVVRPVEAQGAFASPAVIALASLFVIAYSLELSGLLSLLIRSGARLCARIGAAGVWVMVALCGAASAFLNNTPIVVLAAPVVRDVARSVNLSPKRFLIPVSYVTILGGSCTLIGTSTNLLVADMARNAGQPAVGMFEMTAAGLICAVAGGLYLYLVGDRLLERQAKAERLIPPPHMLQPHEPSDDATLGDPTMFAVDRPLDVNRALASLAVFVGVIVVSAVGIAPIASAAFAGAVLLILLRVISPDDAYKGMRPEVLLLIAGMVVVGIALEVTGLAASATAGLIAWLQPMGPWVALAIFYGAVLFLTEALSNATVAVLVTPVAVALAESLGVSPRPFLVALMLAASNAFATPFGYQTNALVFQLGGYSYMDFVRVGLPLNLLTWAVAVSVIPLFTPF